MGDIFDRINIYYEKEKKDIYGYIAEFFKLCGVFVVRKEEGKPDPGDYTKSFRKEDGNFVIHYERREYNPLSPVIHLCDYTDGDRCEVLPLVTKKVFPKMPFHVMKLLEKVYEDYNLFYHNTLEQYYYYPSSERLVSSYVAFKMAYEELDQMHLDFYVPDMRYFDYFKLSCKSKMNWFCDMLKMAKDFSTEDMVNEGFQLAIEYEGFYQGFILAGLNADKDIRYATLSRACYITAMDKAPKDVQGYLHYRLARYYEKIERDYGSALEELREADRILPNNYRILYKKGRMEYCLGMINASYMDFQDVCVLLSDAVEVNCLEPMEIEYLSKSYSMLQIIYSMWFMEKGSSRIVEEKIDELEEVIDRDIYFDKTFGDADKERELLKQHLRLGEVCR